MKKFITMFSYAFVGFLAFVVLTNFLRLNDFANVGDRFTDCDAYIFVAEHRAIQHKDYPQLPEKCFYYNSEFVEWLDASAKQQ